MQFATRYAPNKTVCFDLEKYEPEYITEQTGYRSTKELVETMILAGKKVTFSRHLMYASDDEFEERDVEELAEKYCELFDLDDVPEAQAKVERMLNAIQKQEEAKLARMKKKEEFQEETETVMESPRRGRPPKSQDPVVSEAGDAE